MKKFLFDNWQAKIVSFILALLLWAVLKGRLAFVEPAPASPDTAALAVPSVSPVKSKEKK